jgi:esterase
VLPRVNHLLGRLCQPATRAPGRQKASEQENPQAAEDWYQGYRSGLSARVANRAGTLGHETCAQALSESSREGGHALRDRHVPTPHLHLDGMPLTYSLVSNPGERAQQRAIFLHGILGRGSNWQTFAKRLLEARPDFEALLVDLRMHGDSQELPPPHTLASAAADVGALIARPAPRPVRSLIGHSFGGKLAIRLLETGAPPGLRQVWVLDASPAERAERAEDDLIGRVLVALGELPPAVPTRSAFIAHLTDRRVERPIAQWLAKNLVRDEQGLRFAVELPAIAALLADHDRSDLWQVVEHPPPDLRLCFVLGGRSRSISNAARERLHGLADRGVIDVFVLPEAGHWLHTDDPNGLLEILAQRLVPAQAGGATP